MINPNKLTKELTAAGIQTNGCGTDGRVWDSDNNEIQDRADVKAVLAAHDPTPTASKLKGKKPKDLTPDERNEILFGHLLDDNGNIK